MKGAKGIKTFLVLILSICMVVTSLTPTDMTKVFAANESTTVYFLNTDEWSAVYAYSWQYNDSGEGYMSGLGDWPGTAATQIDGTDWWKVEVPIEAKDVFGIKFNDNGDKQSTDISSINNDAYLYTTVDGKRYATALEAENATGKVSASTDDGTTTIRDVFNGTDIRGNKIEAEIRNQYSGTSCDKSTAAGQSGIGNLGGSTNGSWVAYNLYFSRSASKINLMYALQAGSGGTLEIYADSMEGEPVGTVTTTVTSGTVGDWSVYKELSADVNISSGYHKIYFKFVTSNYVANIDYFTFESPFENISDAHEAEAAHSYTIGAVTNSYSVQENGSFSNGKAIGDLNTWESEERAYFTKYVRATYGGTYTLKIKYATECSSARIDYRINGNGWNQTTTSDTAGSWYEVKEITVDVILKKGINTIDITGAVNTDAWNWVNIDSFELVKNDESKYSIEAFPFRDTTLTGNIIEAESFTTSDGKGNGTDGGVWPYLNDSSCSNNGYLGHTLNGSWAEYDVYFDRKTSEINFRYSAKFSNAAGKINVYVDDMSGSPAAVIETQATSTEQEDNWATYVTVKSAVQISDGNHKIYLQFVPNDGMTYVANIDYFSFNYAPEELSETHEAENAHAYTQGSGSGYTIQSSTNYSGREAVGGMDTWAADGRAYMTTYVDAPQDGVYNLVIGYAAGSDYDTNIDFRINSNDDSTWESVSAPKTGGWDTVGKITVGVELTKGVNIIDITGASNIQYGVDDAWQWVNLDYFKLEDSNIAVGKPVYVNGTSDDNVAGNAVDGDNTTRWASNSEGGWIYVDLQSLYEIERVDVLFEAAYAKDFEIQLSRDNKTWVTAKTVTNFLNGEKHDDDGKVSPLTYTSKDTCLGKARYVKIKANAMQEWHKNMSIWELKVYGTKVPGYISDVAVNKEVTATAGEADNLADNAADGKDTTRWATPKSEEHPEYTINLGKEYELHSIDLKFERAYAQSFTISTSKDGKTWTQLKSESGWTEPGTASELLKDDILGYSFHFDPVDAQYVKLYVDERANTEWGVSLYEFEVWAKDNEKLEYWKEIGSRSMGVYPVTKLQDTKYENSVSDTYPLGVIDSSLVTGDILLSDDTYEIVYDPSDRDIFFYVNPRDINVDYDTQEVFWSNGNSGAALWGAENHDENIAKYIAKQQATVQYQLPENLDFGGNDYVTTQIGCRIYNLSDIENGTPVSGAKPVFSIRFNLKILNSHGIYVEDTISQNGCLLVRDADTGKHYVWEKSKDGKTWETVTEKRKDVQVISNNGAKVNVADDLGGGYYYRVKAEGGEWSQPYHVQYYNNVQNGDFEFPAMFSYDEETGESMNTRFPLNPNGDEQQYPNGFEGLFWKTTGPGYYNTHNKHKTTHDIEIVNGRNLRTDREANQQSGFSVTQEDMYGDNSHGDQFAELNCEEIGSLYQDILTTPGSECYWDLDHAGRWQQNSMLVVAMSSNDALNYTKDTEIEKIIAAAEAQGVTTAVSEEYEEGHVITLENGVQATVWKVTSQATAGEWKHNSGKYTVPAADKNYLTRFFFVSIEGSLNNGTEDRTVGNLLDNVTFEQKKEYTIKYVVNGEEVYTTTGIVNPYDRVEIPGTLPSDVVDKDGNYIDLSQYTLKESNIVKYQRDSDGNIIYDGSTPATTEEAYYIDNSDRNFTVAYDHDTLIIYYESGIVTLTKRVEGLTNLPDDYTVKLTVKDGSTEKYTKTFSKSDFTAIDNADGSVSDSFFATVSFEASEILTNATTYTVTEESVKPMIGTAAYLTQVTAGSTVNEVPLSDLTKDTVTYSDMNFQYFTNADNSELFVNTYKSTHKVTLTKKVTGNMGEKEKATKDFNFTVGITDGITGVNAVMCDDMAVTNSETGKYEFDLKDSESISFIVYDGCTVTVTEQKEEWYSTTYTVDGVETSVNSSVEVEDITNPVMTTKTINNDVNITCINNSEDLGDVEVQGYQMNTSTVEGAPAQYSPSFRVVCRVSKNTIKRRKVVKAGVIFGTADAVGSGANAIANLTIPKSTDIEDGGTAGAEKEGVDGKIAENIYYHEETPGGYYGEWTTREDDEHPYTHWNYYALTFYGTSYMYGMLTQDLTYRAYAVVEGTSGNYDYMEDGKYYKYEYGNDIYTINMYEIAQNLYENQKMSTEAAHNFLYNNILNVVTMDKNRLEIANAMIAKLGITSKDHKYNLVNACYKNMYDYIHCLSGYKYNERGTAVPNKDFTLKNYNVDGSIDSYNTELLTMLNEASDTNYESLSQWIYFETGNIENKKISGTYYSGYYRMVPYAWNNGIVTDYDEDDE